MSKWVEKAKARLTIIQEQENKASDLDIIVSEIMKLPYGQLKKVLTDEVMTVLEKYGYSEVE